MMLAFTRTTPDPGGNRYNREHLMDEPVSRSHFRPEAVSKPREISITLHVNGDRRTLSVAPWTTLLDALRERLQLTGTKKGCDHGQCGACTVLVEGRRVNACLTLAVMKDGAHVTTIEGLATDGALHPLQQKFLELNGLQCGICTPGILIAAKALLERNPDHIDVDAIPEAHWRLGDACELSLLESIKIEEFDVVIAATGDDKVNLVVSLLAKTEYGVPRTVARVST